MPNARFVLHAPAKLGVICTELQRAGQLEKADLKSLARAAGISYSTLKSAVQQHRFSPKVESALSVFAKFDCSDPSWIDEAVPEAARRNHRAGQPVGRDTVEQFRRMLNLVWNGDGVSFRASQQSYTALDPHMAKHELSDLGQAASAGADMQFFLTAKFEPFYHRSGIVFGFRKAAVVLDIECTSGAYATRRLGHPQPVLIGDATITGDSMSHRLHWQLERTDQGSSILAGEYRTCDAPLFAIAAHDGGTVIATRLEVNIFDRATYVADGPSEISANKQALIEQIFWKELPSAEARNGWITLSQQATVVARYEH